MADLTNRDVFYSQNAKGTWICKALTEAGRAVMGAHMGGPWQLAKKDGIFVHVPPSKWESYLGMLRANGLRTEPEERPRVDISSITDF